MKYRIFPVMLSLMMLASCSKDRSIGTDNGSVSVVQSSSVPAATTTAFANEFNGASAIEWMRNSSSSFTVQFNQGSERHSAGYDDNGHRSSHSVICTTAAVPQVILDAFRQQFSGDLVYEWKLNNDGSWKAHFMRSGVKYEATFSATGSLLKFERSA